ncbi:MAG TPA: nucleoside hydrolase [Rugosimonospora sp.]|nr:nucleoside hydrolase [Rugosimonospora sp.]
MKPERRRVIINSDAKNEADDQFAIVHALLSPSLAVRGLIPAHFGTARSDRSMAESREEIDRLLDLLALPGRVPVANGASTPVIDRQTPQDSPGARLIVTESTLATPDDPLYVAFLGPLTDMASAILLDPEIVRRPVVVIWIGGVGHGGVESYPGVEFNLGNDITAANLVFDSGITLWQVPSNVYSQVSVGYAELAEKIGGTSDLADYLIRQMVEWNATYWPVPIESRSLGDSPAVSLLLYPGGGTFRCVPAPRFGREGHYLPGSGHPIRVVESVDVRFLIEDMFAKIRRFGKDTSSASRLYPPPTPATPGTVTRPAYEGDQT